MTVEVPIQEWKHRTVRAHRKQVFCVGFNVEGKRLASGAVDATIKITRVDDSYGFKQEQELRVGSEAVHGLHWHPSHADKLVSIAQQDKNVRFWDLRNSSSKANVATVATPAPNMYITWSSDGHYVAFVNSKETVSVLDVRSMKVLHKYPNKEQVNALAWSRDLKLFFQCVGSGELEVYSYPEMKRLRGLHGHTAGVYAVALDKQDKYMATGGADAVACLWDSQDFVCLRTYIKMDNPIRSLNFSHDSRYLALMDEKGTLTVENVDTGANLGRVVVSASHNIDDVAWHPKQYMLAYPGYSGRDHMGEHANIEFRWLPQQ